jgi:hypothetical protein
LMKNHSDQRFQYCVLSTHCTRNKWRRCHLSPRTRKDGMEVSPRPFSDADQSPDGADFS